MFLDVNGAEPFVYQWFKNDQPLSEQSGDTLKFDTLVLEDSGNYQCIVSNNGGEDTSLVYSLKVLIKSSILEDPQDVRAHVGDIASFCVLAQGTEVSYQWLVNGEVIDSATDSCYTTQPLLMIDSGSSYHCIVRNAVNSDTSEEAILRVIPTFKVAYNANGATAGNPPLDGNSYEAGDTVIVLGNLNNLMKNGYTFAGWNTAVDGSGISYPIGSKLTMGNAHVVLYAQWSVNPTFTITYNGNGSTSGKPPVDSVVYSTGSQVIVLGQNTLGKSGFTFIGWNAKGDGTGSGYIVGATFILGSEDVILYAQWTENPTYIVNYDGNGAVTGNVPIDGNNYESGDVVTVLGNTGSLLQPGYTFVGWNTKADGTGIVYIAGAILTMGTENITLFAQWSLNPTYAIEYDGNGAASGNVPIDANSYETGDDVTVLGNIGSLSRPGYTFVGWNTRSNGTGISYTSGDTFTMGTANVILYALWSENPTFTVSYDGNGAVSGTVPKDTNKYETGDIITVLGNTGALSRPGYQFNGWNTEADGSGVSYPTGATFTMGSTNVELHAQWISIYIIIYNDNGSIGGNVPVDNNLYKKGDVATVLGNNGNLIKTGYNFEGWNTKADGSGTSYAPGATLTISSSDVTLYAQWTKIIFKVKFTAGSNGAILGYLEQNIAHGEDCSPVTPDPNDNYHFTGWTGDFIGKDSPLTVTNVTKNMIITANFTQTYVYKVAAGGNHSMFLRTDSTLWVCGKNKYGQLGDGSNINRNVPVLMMHNVKDMACGGNHSLIIKTDNSLWATGKNEYGQLGDGTNSDKNSPVKVMDDVKIIACGEAHSLIIKTDNTLWAMGDNYFGQLGDSTDRNKNIPVMIMSYVLDIAAGSKHSLVLKTDNSLWATGGDDQGQLGNGAGFETKIPVLIMDLVTSIACGTEHSLILRTNNSLWTVGDNWRGQLGDGSSDSSSRHNPIEILSGVVDIDGGASHTMIIRTGNALWGTGNSFYGQMGNGTTSATPIPESILEHVLSIACGLDHTIIVKTDKTVWSTGLNSAGELGLGIGVNEKVLEPVEVNFQ